MILLHNSQLIIRNSQFKSHLFPMTQTKPYPGTQAVLRAFSVLKVFSDERPFWGLTELAKEVELNKTTTYRLLTALESEGMVIRNRDETYRLGPEAVVLGGRALRQNDVRRVTRPYLERLAEETGETTSLDVLVEQDMLLIDEVIGHRLTGSMSSLGTRHPAYATASGKAVLAFMSPAEVEPFLQRPLPAITPTTITSPDLLRQQLDTIRELGFALNQEELEEGLVVVAAPIYNHDSEVIGSVSLGGTSLRFTPERIVEMGNLIRETAVEISQKLGYRK